ncbi:MAG: BamA/TamA family outer membrane protein [Oligoflexia bacterium]|nr:BamA/TamA family outer membrane protein [Oligoflexia bacterium]
MRMLKKNLQKLVLISSLSLNFSLFASQAPSFHVTKIVFKDSLSPVGHDYDLLYGVLGLAQEGSYTEEQIREGMERLQTHLPYTVKGWTNTDGVLTVSVSRKSKISMVDFEGNENVKDKYLIKNMGFEPIGAYCEDVCGTMEDRIIKYYKNEGYYMVKVSFSSVLEKEKGVKVIYVIEEGRQAVFSDVEIEVKGAVSPEYVVKKLNIRKGDNAGFSAIHREVKKLRGALYDRGYYSQTITRNSLSFNPDMSRAVFKFAINSGPKYRIVFRGNETFPDVKELLDALDITESDSITPDYYRVLVGRLKSFYSGFGMEDAEISVHEELGARPGDLLLIFNIKEPPRKYFTRIIYKTSDEALADEISDYVEDNNRDIFESGSFVKETFEKIKTDIKTFLERKGYLKQRIREISYIKKKDNFYYVKYDIDEGDRTILRSFSVSGNSIFKTESIRALFDLATDEPFDLGKFDTGLKELTLKYKSSGYIDFAWNGRNLTSYSKDLRFVDINLDITEGQRYKVGNIFVEGITKTKDKVVVRELLFEENDWLDATSLQDSEVRLVSLGLFKSVSVIVLPVSEKGGDFRDVLAKLEEKRFGSYEIGVGYRTDEGIRVFSGVEYNNLGGWNRRVSADAVVNRRLDNEYKFIEYDFTLGYYEPYLMNIPFNFRTSTRFIKDDLPSYDKKKFDLSFYFEKGFGRHSLILRNAFERVNIFNANIDYDNAIYWKYSIRQMYQYDSRDSVFNPGRGFKFLAYVEWGHSIQSDIAANYLKFADKGRIYIPVLENWTIASALGMGYVTGLSGSYLLVDDRFALGGSGSLRGFREGIISDITPELVSQYYYTFSLELRRKLIWNLVGLVFYDIGDIYTIDTGLNGPYSSVGGGLSLTFAVGALSFEYGYIYDKNRRIPADRVGRLHLSIQ